MVRGLVADVWISTGATNQLYPGSTLITGRLNHSFFAKARLAPGASFDQATAEVATISARLAQQYPESNEGLAFAPVPSQDVVLNPSVDGAITGVAFVLMGIPVLVLLIVCANLATLLFTRGAGRQREFAVRLALGAGRTRIGEAHHVARDGDRGSRAGPAGDVAVVEDARTSPVGRPRAHEAGSELVEVRLAHEERPSVDQTLDNRRALGRYSGKRRTGGGRRNTRDVDVVLDRERDSEERLGLTGLLPLSSTGDRALQRLFADRVDPHVVLARLLHSGNDGLDDFLRSRRSFLVCPHERLDVERQLR
jgi:hypothetical protein